jgi:hypothetical protein
MWESIRICFIVWRTASETHETLKSVYRNEAVSHTCVLNCSQESEGDMRIWKLIQGVCIHQLLSIQKELPRLVNAGQRLLNARKLMKDQLCGNWETHCSWYLGWRNMCMMFCSHSPMDKQNEHRIITCEVYCSVEEISHPPYSHDLMATNFFVWSCKNDRLNYWPLNKKPVSPVNVCVCVLFVVLVLIDVVG